MPSLACAAVWSSSTNSFSSFTSTNSSLVVMAYALGPAVRKAGVDVERVPRGDGARDGCGGRRAALRGDIPAYRPTDNDRVFRKADEMPGLVTARLPNAADPR